MAGGLGWRRVLLSLKAESQEVRLRRPEGRCLTSRRGTDTQTHIHARTFKAAADCEYTHTRARAHLHTRSTLYPAIVSCAPPAIFNQIGRAHV